MQFLSVVPDATVFGPQVAGGVFFMWFFWQVYAPKWLNVDTALAPLFELPSRVDDVEEKTDQTREHVEQMDKKQTHHIQVTRANSRALDERRDISIDSENVDKYLVENGIPITALTRDKQPPSTDGDADPFTEQQSRVTTEE